MTKCSVIFFNELSSFLALCMYCNFYMKTFVENLIQLYMQQRKQQQQQPFLALCLE